MSSKIGKNVSGEALTKGIREAIERQAKIGGGISRQQAMLLFAHIDRLTELLETIISEGEDWDSEQWSLVIEAALPLLDGWTVRTSTKLGYKRFNAKPLGYALNKPIA